jgi:hypothetical protein
VVENAVMARSKAPAVKIIVDVHERQSGIAGTLVELGAAIEIAPLPAGDYAVGANTLVERKRVLDLHAAVLKGRFWPQLGKLRAACAFPYLLVEGSDLDRGPLHHNAVRGVCLAVIDQGIALLRSGYQRDSPLGSTGLPFVASSSSPLPSDPRTRSDPDRNRVRKLRKRSSPPCQASRPRPRAPYSSASAASPPWLPPTGPTGSLSPGSDRNARKHSRKPSTSAAEAATPTSGKPWHLKA